jgi:transposase
MEAFAERFGFRFEAHERGDANRSARVERPFDFIENNFLAGRRFASWDDLNQQARPVVRSCELHLQEAYPRRTA